MSGAVVALGRPVLTAAIVTAIENRMLMGAAVAVAEAAAVALLRPNPVKLVPYLGWGIAIGSVIYASYEAYSARGIDWGKLERESYNAADMAVFRMGFSAARTQFLESDAGATAAKLNTKSILIPEKVMPMVAAVDQEGIGLFGDILRWDTAGALARRSAAMRGRPPVGTMTDASGTRVRGSWEEYPFAVTVAPRSGVHVGAVPLRENWIQGGFIRAAQMAQGLRDGDTVRCYILRGSR